MATTGILNGTALLMYVGGVAVSHSTNFTLNLNHSVRDATTKDSFGWRDVLEGLRDWTMDGEAMMAFDATLSFSDLFAYYTGRTKITVLFSTEVSGDDYYTGSAYIGSMSKTAGVEESVTFSFSLEGTGALTEGQQT